MKHIVPYKTARNALAALDNGGRFYNLITQANDGHVTRAELARVAGVFNDRQKMVLYLEMSISELDQQAVKDIRSSLSPNLKLAYKRYCPQQLLPSEAQLQGRISSNAIITGVPKFVKSNSDFTGFIMIPISTGKTTTFMMVPIIDVYDVYEIRDNKTAREFLIAHARGSAKLPAKPVRCGGIIKELKPDKKPKTKTKPKKFLETLYYALV
ncbi:MAG: hypothetical protein HQ515_16890 [Phycisphaeraceae bacterium]|nr:hypothetical protein [Phycisphaeraceae bacterium]